MAKFKLIFFSILLAAIGAAFIYGGAVFQYFQPKFSNFENAAIKFAAQEAKKQFSAPPPLRKQGISAGQKTGDQPKIAPSPASQPVTAPAAKATLTRDGTILWTNSARRINGNLPPLAENSELDAVAEIRLKDMFANQYFAHISPTGDGAEKVADRAGYAYVALGENIALGNFKDDDDLVTAWMMSPGHRANILNIHYQEIGVAVGPGMFEGEHTWIGVQIFGKPASACPYVDPSLKTKINNEEGAIKDIQQRLAALKQDIGNSPPGEERNQKIDQYNSLAADYNSRLVRAKADIDEYNSEVTVYNACLAQ